MILTENKEHIRFLKFAAVGTIGAVIDFGVMNFLSHAFDMKLVYAGTISFICAVISNFLLNRYWTYPDSRSRHILHQLSMFFIVNAAGITIRIPILHFVEPITLAYFSKLASSSLSPEFLAKNFTLALAVGIVMLWNFFINRYWTYNDID